MRCTAYEAAIVDEALARPEGFEAHLATCASCQAFRRAHSAALRLEGVTPVRRRDAKKVEAVRRQVLGLAWVSLAVVLMAGAGWKAIASKRAVVEARRNTLVAQGAHDEARASAEEGVNAGPGRRGSEAAQDAPALPEVSPLEWPTALAPGAAQRPGVEAAALTEAEREAAAEWAALWRLRDAVALGTRRNLSVVDVSYARFGALPQWVAPQTTHPIRALGRAAHPLVYTSEE